MAGGDGMLRGLWLVIGIGLLVGGLALLVVAATGPGGIGYVVGGVAVAAGAMWISYARRPGP